MLVSLKKLIAIFNNQNPSKWGKGTGLLWRGNTLASYWQALLMGIPAKDGAESSRFLFESCRVAIYHFAKFSGVQSGDKVQVMGFTCDAVTDALLALNCDVELYDCDIEMRCPSFQILENTTLIVSQVSFGVAALSDEVLAEASSRGIAILLDKSLSYGIRDFDDVDDTIYPTVLSFEVSKSVTIGWGGLLVFPASGNLIGFKGYYNELKEISILDDMSRVLRTAVNLAMVKNGSIYRYWIWLILRGLGWHRASVRSSGVKYKTRSIMGPLSKRVFESLSPEIPSLLERSNNNHERLRLALESLGLKVISRIDRQYSSPRIVFLVHKDVKLSLCEWLNKDSVEMGIWFDQMPILGYYNATEKLSGTTELMNRVVNLSCHWSISSVEIDKMIESVGCFFAESDHV